MSAFELPALIAAVFWFIAAVRISSMETHTKSGSWIAPTLLMLLFLAFSLIAVVADGPLGFWPILTVSLWGNQVWFDLLLALAMSWYLLMPRLKAMGMVPWPWLAFIATTGSIGALTTLARVLWLEQSRDNQAVRSSEDICRNPA